MNAPAYTLFWARHVCSLAAHVALREAGASFDLARVDLATKTLAGGEDYRRLVPQGYVPALRLPDGSLLAETAIILHFVADAHPEARLAPPRGAPGRLRFDERMHFIATELHKGFAPFTIMPNAGDEAKRWAKARLDARAARLSDELGDRPYFEGEAFTAVDAYAYWALLTYHRLTGAALGARLDAYLERVAARPAVRAAHEAEAAAP